MGEWNEVFPREGFWTKGGECEEYGTPLFATTLSPTWEVVAAPRSIASPWSIAHWSIALNQEYNWVESPVLF